MRKECATGFPFLSSRFLLRRVEPAGFEGRLHRPPFVDIEDHDLGAGVVLPRVDHPPGRGQHDDADEDDAVVVHGFCCRGDTICCGAERAVVSLSPQEHIGEMEGILGA